MAHADIIVAILGVFALGWLTDSLTGRRGLFGATLVAAIGAACGWFLSVRVFAASTMDEVAWVGWSGAGSVLCLLTFFLFRNTR